MKMQNKKRGFTIVELVIVIAVIAILAGVLVPTFTGIVKKAKASARAQQAASTYQVAIAYSDFGSYDNGDEDVVDAYIVVTEGNDEYYFAVEGGVIADETTDEPANFEDYVEVNLAEDALEGVKFYKYSA